MQHQQSTIRKLCVAALMAAAVGAQGVALAADAPAVAAPAVAAQDQAQQAGSKAEHKHGKHHMRHKHLRHHAHKADMALWVPGYGFLGKQAIESLSLNDKQQTLLSDAQQAGKALRQARRAPDQATRKAELEALQAGRIDPRARLEQRKQHYEQARQARAQVSDKWLAFWDALDDGQHKQIATQLAQRASKRAEWAAKRAAHKAEQGKTQPAAGSGA